MIHEQYSLSAILHVLGLILNQTSVKVYSIHTVMVYLQVTAPSGYQPDLTSPPVFQYDRVVPPYERWVWVWAWVWRLPCDLPGRWKKRLRRVPILGLLRNQHRHDQ
jgi:hypothetical protein